MADKHVVFPIVIANSKRSTEHPYLVSIPDFDGMTEATSIADGIEMARDWIGSYSLVKSLPNSNYHLPSATSQDVVTLVDVNIDLYKRLNDQRSIKKTLTIPNYLNELGVEAGINFSETLTEALKQKLRV
ncbi:MAG TPA: toxin-antitoxin system, antitoxin component, HicB family protein [Lactobacillus sp.]|nr:toxin-antitoxin system, antitoxin component, HicB family protein [Lactobacillus sp.]